MALFNFRRWLARQSRSFTAPRRRQHSVRPRLQTMEERVVPATFTVINTADSGAGSLRAAITSANSTPGPDDIVFTGVSGTITLLTALPNVSSDMVINGPGAANLTVTRDSAAANFRIFTIQRAPGPKINVTIRGLTVSNGIGTPDVDGSGGGGISTDQENVRLDSLVVTGNRSSGPGGGVDSRRNTDLTIINTTISGNSSGGFGGGLYAGDNGRVLVLNSTVSGNTAFSGGAGLYFYGRTPASANWVVQNSTISGNLVTTTGTTGAGIMLLGQGNGLTVQNSTITANQAQYAAGIFSSDPDDIVRLESTIVSGNIGGFPGTDVYMTGVATWSARNSAIGSAANGAFTDLGGNLAPGTPVNLGPLASNGGPTQSHLPLAGSPVINAGFNAVVQGIDQRGFQRTAGTEVDMGAVESGATPTAGNIPVANTAIGVTAAGFQVQVVYTDDTAINAATIDTNDLTFTRPDGTPVTATIGSVSVSPAGNGTPRTATYTVNPPGGTWDAADSGVYYVRSVAGQVTDTSGNGVTAGILGQFVLTVVTTTADSGPGSLRQAILDSNASPGFKNVIAFFVGTGPATISPASPLPAITDSVLIDATTQPGFAGAPIVELAGNLTPAGSTGLELSAASNTVRGLVLNRWGTALIAAGANQVIQGNYIGTNAAGTAASPNGIGVYIVGANGALVGSDLDGTNDAAERNVISGNTTAGIRGGGASALLKVVQWTTGPGANNHYYLRAAVSASWVQAEQFAAAFGGHLASIGSADENAFVANNVGAGWIGFTDDGAFGGTEFGNTSGGANRGEGWVWTDGTPAPYPVGGPAQGFQNWNGGEPNDVGNEDYAEIQGTGGWNDLSTQQIPGIAEFTTAPNVPAILAALGGGAANRIQGNYIGTNAAGTGAIANATGLDLHGSLGDTVRGNVISGNTGAGITVSSAVAVGPNGNFYLSTPTAMTFTNAEAFAVTNGGHLVSIASATENAIVLGVGTGWIGFTDDAAFGGSEFGNTSGLPNRGEGWVWTDGTPAPYPVGGPLTGYMNWNGGEPNNAGTENYAEITGGGGWNDLPNNTLLGIMELTSAPSAALLGIGVRTAGGLTITGNIIGRNAANTADLANGGAGISVADNSLITIGGTGAGAGNTIRGNTGAGIAVTGNNTSGVTIRGNSITGNGGLGIDLGTAGVTPNDTLDSDTGPNGLQNFPAVTTVVTGATTTVSGNINSTPNTQLTIDFYASAAADPSGNGEGERYLGSTTVTTDGFGNASFANVVLAASTASGEFISATATDPSGNTSEFAVNANTGAPAAPTVASVAANGRGDQRSEVRSVVVTFSGPVTFTGGNANAAAAFALNRIGGGAVGLTAAVSTDGQGRTVVTLTFSGAETDPLSMQGTAVPVPGPSLVDGRYQLTILSSNVSGTGGNLDGDNNGTAGGNYQNAPDTAAGGAGQVRLYRLFGDATGNGNVDLQDLQSFRATFNATFPAAGYLNYMDANNDGTVDLNDLSQFRTRFNINILP